jgi:hypothetical protein
MTAEQPMQPEPGAPPQPHDPWVPGAPLVHEQSYLPVTPATGEVGKVRGTGVCMLLAIVTLGIYTVVWYYKTHDEMKRHTGQGLGGVLALVINLIFGIASPFLSSNEVGALYERRGQAKPVSALTGLWVFPGIFLLVGPIIWFVKTNGALNAYWRSLGAS